MFCFSLFTLWWPGGVLSADRNYCTFACMDGLKHGEDLDEDCPNVESHRRESRPRKHCFSTHKFMQLAGVQLARTTRGHTLLHNDIGPDRAVFKMTLLEFGYTFVGKGVVDDQKLLHDFTGDRAVQPRLIEPRHHAEHPYPVVCSALIACVHFSRSAILALRRRRLETKGRELGEASTACGEGIRSLGSSLVSRARVISEPYEPLAGADVLRLDRRSDMNRPLRSWQSYGFLPLGPLFFFGFVGLTTLKPAAVNRHT